MGLFDFILKDKNVNIANEKEAYFAIIYSCAAVDGEIAPEESAELVNLVKEKELFRGQNLEELLIKVRQLYKDAGSSSGTLIMQAIPKLDKHAKEDVYVSAMLLFFADGSVQGSERKLLEDLQEALEISDTRASELSKSVK